MADNTRHKRAQTLARKMALKEWSKDDLVEEVIDLGNYVKILLKRLHPEDYE